MGQLAADLWDAGCELSVLLDGDAGVSRHSKTRGTPFATSVESSSMAERSGRVG